MAQYGVYKYGDDTFGLSLFDFGDTVASISHFFNLARIDLVEVPTAKAVWNQFDEHGLTTSLARLDGEYNWSYRRRLQDVLVHIANASYRGMVHGITRELGLSLFYPLIINPKADSSGHFLAPDPYIRFDGAYLYLYSDYQNGLLDWAIDRFEPGGNYEHIGRLVELINTTSFFEAHLMPGQDPYTRSMTVINQSNRVMVDGEVAQESTKFKLDHNKISPGTVSFLDKYTFAREVNSIDLVVSAGQYYIDYDEGLVTVATIPPPGTIIRYAYSDYSFKPIASPVIVHDITNENFKTKMFEQILQDDGTYAHGIATALGIDIINELLSVTPLYWGI